MQDLDTKIAADEARVRDLLPVKVQVYALEAKKRLLDDELDSIERLNRDKGAAVPPAVTPRAGGAAAKERALEVVGSKLQEFQREVQLREAKLKTLPPDRVPDRVPGHLDD